MESHMPSRRTAAQTGGPQDLDGALDVRPWEGLLQSTSMDSSYTDSTAAVGAARGPPRPAGARVARASLAFRVELVPAPVNVADLPGRG